MNPVTPEEIFDIVDTADQVIGAAPRSEVHARRLLHRAVNIFVFNTAGELLVQKRSATKDEFPLCYTSSASGHVSSGETYDQTAPRELAEELGLSGPLEFLVKLFDGEKTACEHSALYRLITDEPPIFDADEIESGAYYNLDDLTDRMTNNPEQFTPPFRVLFRWYLENA